MSWIDAARARLHLVFARRATESRIQEEIGFHIEMETERLVREEGLPRDEARRRALVHFGGVVRHTEALRDGRGLGWLSGLSLDVKLALRMTRKNPGLTLVAVIGMSVAVTIGSVAFSAIYTLIDGRLPISEGDRVIGIRNIDTKSIIDGRQTHLHDLATWRETLSTVPELGAYRTVDRNLITGDGRSESARIAEMSASGFRIARVPPLMGRYFDAEDERIGAPPVVVIGYDVWQSRLAARPDVVGQIIQLGDTRHTVIGVMPKGFAFPVNNRVWTPLRLDPAVYDRGSAPMIAVFGRLAPDATIDDARRQLATINHRLAAEYPQTHASLRQRVVPYTRTFIDNPEMVWLYHLGQLMVTMLLVVIGTNVAILIYARTASRMGEIAIRTALGASRRRIVAQLFAEALVLSTMAAAVGLVTAQIVLRNIDAAIERIGGEQLPFWLRFRITPGVVLYAAGLAILAAVIVGVVPALKATRHQVRSRLQQLSGGTSAMRLGKLWTFLIVAQVTAAVSVLPVAIAGIAAWQRVESAKVKLARKQIVSATVVLDRPEVLTGPIAKKRSVLRKLATLGATAPANDPDDREFAARYLDRRAELVRRLEVEPGVTMATFATSPPGAEPTIRVEAEPLGAHSVADTLAARSAASIVVEGARIDLNYFATLGISVLAGRSFQPGDLAAPTTAVIVNRSFVRKLGTGNPLGRRIRSAAWRDVAGNETAPAPWEEIVGVVPDFPIDSGTPAPKIYRPLPPTYAEPVTVAVRVRGVELAPFTKRLRALALATDPMLRLEGAASLDQILDDESAGERFVILGLELVTASTVLLSVAGIYALMSFTITRRRREIGIRSALGAGPRRLLFGVLSRVLAQVALGITIGIILAGVIDHAFEGGWTGRRGALVLPGVAALMVLVSIIAAMGPARRALRIHPTEALRSD